MRDALRAVTAGSCRCGRTRSRCDPSPIAAECSATN